VYLRNQVARLANINVETLRYYEKIGLIDTPDRNESGYRIYNDKTLERLEIIKRAKTCGLTLEETKELIEVLYRDAIDYTYISKFIDNKIDLIDSKINELNSIKQILNTMKTNINNKVECPLKNSF
jgi:DNA-binding transcriptional MerR regulator